MKKINIKLFARKLFKIFAWAFLIIVAFFIIGALFRIPHYLDSQKTEEQITKIHSTKLQMKDVEGSSLPPDPGMEADKTIQGIDKNNNGIRDDVELAIFKEYPNSAKTRAVLLQYALSLQMVFIQPFVNEEIATEVITEQGKADTCLSDTLVPRISPDASREYVDMEKIDKYISFVEEKQINNTDRKNAYNNFYNYLRSYGESTNEICDIDLSNFSNLYE